MEKIYRVQMNSKGMPNFSTAVEVADRPQEWIPCSERLPKDWEHVLVCTTVTYTTPIFVDWYVDEVGSWANEGDSVIAWMPLPKPFEGADDEH